MYPKIFNKTEVEFKNNGLGFLSDVIKLLVTEERNAGFYLEMEYPIDGLNSKYLKYDYIIMAKPNPIDRPQPFRIYYSKKSQNGRSILVKANHVTFDDSNNFLLSFKKDKQQANFILNDLNNAKTQKNKIKYSTNINTSISIDWSKKSPTNAIAGEEGSFIQALNSEIKRDIWSVSVNSSRGRKSDYVARDEKGLTEFDYEEDISEVVTKIYPFKTYKPDNSDKDVTITLSDKFIVSENADKYPFERIAYLDLSQDETIKSENDLRKVALKKFTQDHVDLPKISGTLKLINLSNNPEYSFINEMSSVLLCDYIWCVSKVINEKVQVQVNKVVFNPILEDYDSIDVGIKKQSLSQSISNSINSVKNEVNNIKNEVSNIVIGEDGLKSITSADMPTEEQYQLKDGDIWFQELPDGNINIWTWDETQKIWKPIFNHDELNQAMEDAELAKKQADTARNEASSALTKADTALTDALNASQQASNAMSELTSFKSETEEQITEIKGGIQGINVDISDLETNTNNRFTLLSDQMTSVISNGVNMFPNSVFSDSVLTNYFYGTPSTNNFSVVPKGESDGKTTYGQKKCLKMLGVSSRDSTLRTNKFVPCKSGDTLSITFDYFNKSGKSNIVFKCRFQKDDGSADEWLTSTVPIETSTVWKKAQFEVVAPEHAMTVQFMIGNDKSSQNGSLTYVDNVLVTSTEVTRNQFVQTTNSTLSKIENLEQKTDTKFLQTDELLAMQAQKIGAYYPNGDFSDKTYSKWYTGNGTITSDSTLKVATDGTNKGFAFLSDYIPVEGNKPMYLSFEGAFSSETIRNSCYVYVHEYDTNKTETRNGSDLVFKNNEPPLRWARLNKTWYFSTSPKYIRIEWVVFNGAGSGDMSVKNIKLTNGTESLTGQISVMNDNINLSVKKGEVISEINVTPGNIRIAGEKIHITGATSIDNAVIQDSMIANLSASKLTAGTIDARTIKVINLDVNSLTGNKAQFIQAAFNSANSSTTINSQGILTKNDHMTTALNAGCLEFRDKNGELSGAFETKDWLLANGLDDTLLLKVLGDRQFTIGLAYDRTKPNDISPAISFKRREERNWMYIEDHDFRIVSRDGYRLRPGSSMNYENNKIYPSLTNDNESVGILLGDKDLIFRDGYRDNAGSNQMSLNRIRSGQLDSIKTPSGGFTWTIKDGTINGNASLVLSGSSTENTNFIGMNNADIWLNASQSVYITDRSGSRYKLEDLRWGRMGQLELPDGSYKMKVVSKTINGNKGIALAGTDGENFIALNNADIWLKAKYNIVFSDGNGNGITLDSLRAGRTGQLQTTSKNYKISIADSSINGNPALALSGTNKDNYIAINNADIYLKAKYNIYFDDGYGSGFTLNQLRQKVEKSASTLIADNGEIHLDSARVKGKQAKILADDEGACIAFADGTLMFRDLETDDWHTLSELLNNKGA